MFLTYSSVDSGVIRKVSNEQKCLEGDTVSKLTTKVEIKKNLCVQIKIKKLKYFIVHRFSNGFIQQIVVHITSVGMERFC